MDAPFQHEGRWVVAVYHPSFVLRARDEKAGSRPQYCGRPARGAQTGAGSFRLMRVTPTIRR
jgi:hypothetical protein